MGELEHAVNDNPQNSLERQSKREHVVQMLRMIADNLESANPNEYRIDKWNFKQMDVDGRRVCILQFKGITTPDICSTGYFINQDFSDNITEGDGN